MHSCRVTDARAGCDGADASPEGVAAAGEEHVAVGVEGEARVGVAPACKVDLQRVTAGKEGDRGVRTSECLCVCVCVGGGGGD